MGTNGIHYLVSVMDPEAADMDRTYERLYERLYVKAPAIIRDHLPAPLSAIERAVVARNTISFLRDSYPESTFATLVHLAFSGSETGRMNASQLIEEYQGKYPSLDLSPFVPDLVRALDHKDGFVRTPISGALRRANLNSTANEQLLRALIVIDDRQLGRVGAAAEKEVQLPSGALKSK